MTARILQFKPKTSDEDVSRICTRIFQYLGASPGVEVSKLIGDFRAENSDLSLADLLAACALCKRVLSAFQFFVLALDREDGEDDDGDAS